MTCYLESKEHLFSRTPFGQSNHNPTQVKGEDPRAPPTIGGYWRLVAMSSYCHTSFGLSLVLTGFQSLLIPSCSENRPPNPNLRVCPLFCALWCELSSPRWLHSWLLFRVGLSHHFQFAEWFWNFAASDEALIPPSRYEVLNSVPSQRVLTSPCGVQVLTSAAWGQVQDFPSRGKDLIFCSWV